MIITDIGGIQQEIKPAFPYIVFVEPTNQGGTHNSKSPGGVWTPYGILVDKQTGELKDHRSDLPATFGYIEELPDDLSLVNAYGGLQVGDLVHFYRYANANEEVAYNWVYEFADDEAKEVVRVERTVWPINIDSILVVIHA